MLGVFVDYVLVKPVETLMESKPSYANLWRSSFIMKVFVMMKCLDANRAPMERNKNLRPPYFHSRIRSKISNPFGLD